MNRSFKRKLTLVLLFSFSVNSVKSMQTPSAQIATPQTEYRGVTLNELVSIYEQAYRKQQFNVHTNVDKGASGGNYVINFIIDAANPAHPKYKKAEISFLIHSAGHNDCAPCSVIRRGFSAGDMSEYMHEKEWAAWNHRLIVADKMALNEIRRKLGKSPGSMEGLGLYWLR